MVEPIKSMEEALEIIGGIDAWIRMDGEVPHIFLSEPPEKRMIDIDGDITARELDALAYYLRNAK